LPQEMALRAYLDMERGENDDEKKYTVSAPAPPPANREREPTLRDGYGCRSVYHSCGRGACRTRRQRCRGARGSHDRPAALRRARASRGAARDSGRDCRRTRMARGTSRRCSAHCVGVHRVRVRRGPSTVSAPRRDAGRVGAVLMADDQESSASSEDGDQWCASRRGPAGGGERVRP